MANIWYCTYFSAMCITAYVEYMWYTIPKFWILTGLLLLDTFTGIAKSYALWTVWEKEYYDNGKVKNNWFNTTVLKVGVIGKVLLLMLPLWMIGVAHLVWVELNRLIPVLVGLIWAAEFISIIQNIRVVRTKKAIQEVDAMSLVLGGLLGIMKWWIEKTFTTQPYKKDGY